LSLRKDSRAISFFYPRSHQSIWRWLHRFGSLSEAFYVGKAKVAVVDERTVIIKGEEAWIWIALEPKSRKLLGLELSWTRNSFVAYLFLKRLKSLYGIRVVVANGAPWYSVCSELRLRLIHDKDLLNLVERLSKEVKRRLKDFDLHFPCRCHTSFRHVKTWLEAWRGYYNWIRYHRSLKASPCGYGGPEPLGILGLIGGDAMG